MAVYRIHKKEWNVWNDLRRFFETIKHFYWLRGNFDAECLKKIFHNFEDKEHKEFFYASNYYSHLLEPFDSLWVENLDKILEQFEELIEKSVFEWLWEEVKTIW
jgi:UDP-2,3-diacylglucosamine pyrophosphatase LpxH